MHVHASAVIGGPSTVRGVGSVAFRSPVLLACGRQRCAHVHVHVKVGCPRESLLSSQSWPPCWAAASCPQCRPANVGKSGTVVSGTQAAYALKEACTRSNMSEAAGGHSGGSPRASENEQCRLAARRTCSHIANSFWLPSRTRPTHLQRSRKPEKRLCSHRHKVDLVWCEVTLAPASQRSKKQSRQQGGTTEISPPQS